MDLDVQISLKRAAVWHPNSLGGFENSIINTDNILKTLEKMWMSKKKERGLIERKTEDLKLSGLDLHFTLLLGLFLIKCRCFSSKMYKT